MNRANASFLGVGAMAGAALRWGLVELQGDGNWQWGLLAANVAGALILGWLLADRWSDADVERGMRLGLGVGFCGSLTTTSTLAVAVAELGREGRWGLGVAYAVVSLAVAGAAVVAGGSIRRRGATR